MVPNFLKVFANSPAALRAFLGLHGIAGEGSLDPQTRERIALALAASMAPKSRPTAPAPAGTRRRRSPSGLPVPWSPTWAR
jgi:hypothetical protein